jgi:transposase, IS5 family
MRQFVGIDLGREPVPDGTTILNFWYLLEHHDLCGQILREVNEYLATRGLRISIGMIVDATIVHAPSSTNVRRLPSPTPLGVGLLAA